MPSNPNDFPARGRIKEVRNGDTIVFLPSGTNYELYLTNTGSDAKSLPTDQPVEAMIRAAARKVWTVPSGGNFIQPIFGPPRIIQGRVKWLDERTLVVHAGTNFVIDMPSSDDGIDLANGGIEAGVMVNVTALPGATIEVRAPATVTSSR